VGEGPKIFEQRTKAEADLREDIAKEGLKIFTKVIVAPSLRLGVQNLIQSFGIGPVHPNTVLLNGPEQLVENQDPLERKQYGKYLTEAIRLGINVVIFGAQEEKWSDLEKLPSRDRRIDVWWRDDDSSRLMLLFAYLMTRHEDWSEARIRVLTPAPAMGAEKSLEKLNQTLQDVRIHAEPEIVAQANLDEVVQQSAETSLVFFPLRVQRNQLVGLFNAPFDQLLSRLPLVALVIAAEDIDLNAEPDAGGPAAIADVLDIAADTAKAAEKAEKEATKAAEKAAERLRVLQDAKAEVTADLRLEKLMKLESIAEESKALAQKAAREANRLRAEADEAARAANAAKNAAKDAEPES